MSQKEKKHSKFFKSIFAMSLCCLLPLILVVSLPVLYQVNPQIANKLAWITPFICPLMMVMMMIFMTKGSSKKGCCHKKES